MSIKNQEAFEKALKTLDDNDRKTLEAFAHFLLVSSNSSLAKTVVEPVNSTNLLGKANEALLAGFTKLKVELIENDGFGTIQFLFEGRDRPQSFPECWFSATNDTLNEKVTDLYVKFRPGTNRIDKVVFDSKLLSTLGKDEGKKRILALNYNTLPVVNAQVKPATTSSSQFVQKIVAASSDGWTNTPAIAKVSVPKNDLMFSKLSSFKEGRLRLSRVGEILFNFIDQMNNNKYTWDSEFFFGAPHDFTNVKTDETYDIKCHFHSGERLQLSDQTLSKCDADYIVAVLVEEDDTTYTATVVGFISTADFKAKTKPWAYNQYVTLHSMELHELNSPKDLF